MWNIEVIVAIIGAILIPVLGVVFIAGQQIGRINAEISSMKKDSEEFYSLIKSESDKREALIQKIIHDIENKNNILYNKIYSLENIIDEVRIKLAEMNKKDK